MENLRILFVVSHLGFRLGCIRFIIITETPRGALHEPCLVGGLSDVEINSIMRFWVIGSAPSSCVTQHNLICSSLFSMSKWQNIFFLKNNFKLLLRNIFISCNLFSCTDSDVTTSFLLVCALIPLCINGLNTYFTTDFNAELLLAVDFKTCSMTGNHWKILCNMASGLTCKVL